MNRFSCQVFAAVIVIVLIVPVATSQGKNAPELSAADRNFLDGLFEEFLFDPRGAQRVEVRITHRFNDGSGTYEERRLGWHVAAKNNVYFVDGTSIPTPPAKAMTRVDFVAACKARLAKKALGPDDPAATAADWPDPFHSTRDGDDLVLAAWLQRLGHANLAAQMLTRARGADQRPNDKLADELRSEIAANAFQELAFAFARRADGDALEHGKRFFMLYGAAAPDDHDFSTARSIMAELDRRKTVGKFDKEPARAWPADSGHWDPKRKLEYLIDQLDEDGDKSGLTTSSFPTAEIIKLGESAVPRLINVAEKDSRLTHRLLIPPPSGGALRPYISVLSVRDSALAVMESILRTKMFDPTAERGYATPDAIRDYFQKYGQMPFDERMMAILTDPKASPAAWREAAANLANLQAGSGVPYSGLIASMRSRPKGPYPALARFKNPTAAEAILAALDREFAEITSVQRKGDRGAYCFPGYERFYVGALIELGDRRIAPILALRSRNATAVRSRRVFAEAAHWLGDSKPLVEFAEACRDGKLALPDDDERDRGYARLRGCSELHDIIATLIAAHLPETERALDSLANPNHPWHPQTVAGILIGTSNWRNVWLSHRYCLPILRRALDDVTLTGANYRIEGYMLWYDRLGVSSGQRLAPELQALELRTDAQEHWCDIAAQKLSSVVVGLPEHHAFLKDATGNLTVYRKRFDQFKGRLRKAGPLERSFFDADCEGSLLLIPEFPALGRPATADDVETGRAVFHLDGKGKLTGQHLPLLGELKPKDKAKAGKRALIVQAEASADGAITYGVIARYAIRAMPASALVRVAPLDAREWQQAP
jgi:hypothetical protein